MALFHPKVIEKILSQKIDIPEDHLEILQNWSRSIADGTLYRQKETALHGVFTQNIVTQVLGYQPFGTSSDHYDVAVEYPIAGTRVDLALGKFVDPNASDKNECIAPFELKGAKTVLDAIMPGRNKTPVQQAWDYAMDVKGAKWVLVSNYVEIRLYAVGYGRQDFERFPLELMTEPEQYKKFYLLLNKDNLLGGQTHEWLKQSEKQDKDITNRLYQDYKIIRHNVIHAIINNNPDVEFQDAVGMAQVILDRVLFVAFAEDKGLLPSDSLKQAYDHKDPYNPKPVWENFKGLFRAIDEGNPHLNIPKYNGGLFKANPAIDNLQMPDSIFQGFKKIGEYDFQSEISVTILGHIFEQSISDIEALKEFGDPNLKKKDGKRKKEGVVYTPDSITRFIVDKTLGEHIEYRRNVLMKTYITKGSWEQFRAGQSRAGEPLAKWKSRAAELEFWREYQELLKTIRVVDPACGSGAFLVAAFDYLYAEFDRVNRRIDTLRGDETINVLFDLDKEILNNNLYGVDVNAESIEITKLSLWLKTAQRGKVLNSLDDNLRVGNSVIEDSDYSYQAFTWKGAFPEVFADGGFDVVLGNPPYVRQEYISDQKPYLQKRYEVYNGVADLYTYFFELGLRILKPNTGRMGYICSATFFKTGSGQNLRRFLSEKSEISTVIDFGDVQIFEGVTTYPAIFVVDNKSPEKDHRIEFLQITEKPEDDIAKTFSETSQYMPQDWLSVEQWNLQDEKSYNLLKKIKNNLPYLKEVYGVPYNGLKTALNKAFVINEDKYDHIIKKEPKSKIFIEPYIDGRSLNKWFCEQTNLWLIHFPKGWTKSNYGDLSEEKAFNELSKDYPILFEWLGKFETPAKKRTDKGDYWWELRANNYWKKFLEPKLIYPEISTEMRVSLDCKSGFPDMTSFVLLKDDMFLYGYLNSKITQFYLLSICTFIRGGYLRMKKQFIETIPIPNTKDEEKECIGMLAEQAQDTAEKRYALQEQVRNRIHDIAPEGRQYDLNGKLKSWWTMDFKEFQTQVKAVFKRELSLKERDEWEEYLSDKRKSVDDLSHKLTALENDLNTEVYKLFDLTPDEIALIEDSV